MARQSRSAYSHADTLFSELASFKIALARISIALLLHTVRHGGGYSKLPVLHSPVAACAVSVCR